MAETFTIARPYAQAVFRLAQENKAQKSWSDRLQRLADLANNTELSGIIGNPKLSAAQVADIFVSLTGEADSPELVRFINVLAENERLNVLTEIKEIYEQLKSEEEGAKDALITSAFALDETQINTLVSQLESHFGSKLQPQVTVDASLIGGVKVAVGDRLLDLSVRGKLDAMATALKN